MLGRALREIIRRLGYLRSIRTIVVETIRDVVAAAVAVLHAVLVTPAREGHLRGARRNPAPHLKDSDLTGGHVALTAGRPGPDSRSPDTRRTMARARAASSRHERIRQSACLATSHAVSCACHPARCAGCATLDADDAHQRPSRAGLARAPLPLACGSPRPLSPPVARYGEGAGEPEGLPCASAISAAIV